MSAAKPSGKREPGHVMKAYVRRIRDLSARELCLMIPPQPPVHVNSNDVEGTFEQILAQRMRAYRQDGLDAVRDLAMMPISPNSMQNQVKFLAATKLLEMDNGMAGSNQPEDLLKRLNAQYQEHAPRIKEVRERIITFDDPKLVQEG